MRALWSDRCNCSRTVHKLETYTRFLGVETDQIQFRRAFGKRPLKTNVAFFWENARFGKQMAPVLRDFKLDRLCFDTL